MTAVQFERPIGPEEVAERLGILDDVGKPNRRRVLAYAREGVIPCVRLSGKCIRFYWSDVERALRSSAAMVR